jgi:hypothetical protein
MQDSGSGIGLEFTNAEPITVSFDLFFDSYYDAEIVEAGNPDPLGRVKVQFHYEVQPGQGLQFAQVRSSPPNTRGAIEIRFELNEDGSGSSVDPANPLYTMTISAQELESVPVLVPDALILLGALVLALGLYGATRMRSAIAG